MRSVKGGHLFVLGLLLVGAIGTSLITDMPVPTENADAWLIHSCDCRTVRVWVPHEITIWAAIRSGGEAGDGAGGYWETRRVCDRTINHWKFWNHGDPC